MALKWLGLGALVFASSSLLWIYLKRDNSATKRSTRRRRVSAADKSSKNGGSLGESKTCAGDAARLSLEAARLLAFLIGNDADVELKQKALITVAHQAAIFSNHEVMREAGCLTALSNFVQSFASADGQQLQNNFPMIETALLAINNLANKEDNMPYLKDCIQSILVIAKDESSCLSEKLRSTALMALVNFTCTDTCFEFFSAEDIQMLLELTQDHVSHDLRLQSLKLLANLSWNHNSAMFIFTAKLPESLANDLGRKLPEDLLLRWLTILRNIVTHRDVQNIIVDGGKVEDASGELALRDILCDGHLHDSLRKNLSPLLSHSDDNILGLINQICQTMSKLKADKQIQ